MPLPTDVTLSLQNNLSAGTSAQAAAPKRAMIVRMSQETLEALEDPSAISQLEFDFGNSPGIYIGSNFFPVQYIPENTPHELFLRTIPAGRTSSSLRLQANVIGKMMVTERNLQDKVGERLRESTTAQVKEREEKRTVMLQGPLPSQAVPVKKAKPKPSGSTLPKRPKPIGAVVSSPAVRRGPPQPIQAKDEGSAVPRPPPPPPPPLEPEAPSPAPTPAEPPKPSKNSHTIRTRLMHCLAAAPRKRDEASRLVIGNTPTEDSKATFRELLSSVADPSPALRRGTSPTGETTYQLKNRLWTEIRPWTWGKLQETERRAMAERACDMFTLLGIPDDNPHWEHVRPRPPSAPSIPNASSSTLHTPKSTPTPAPPKQDAPSQPKPKPRPVPVKSKVDSKDEPRRGTPTTARAKAEDRAREEPPSSSRPVKAAFKRDRERGDDPPPQSPALSNASVSRRPPAASSKVVKRESPMESGRSSRGTPQPPQPSQAQARGKKMDVVDSRPQRDEPTSSNRGPPPPAKERDRDKEKTVKKRPAEEPLASDREKDSTKRHKLPQASGMDRDGPTASGPLKKLKIADDEDKLVLKPRDKERQKDRENDRGRERERDRKESAPIPRRDRARDASPARKIPKREHSMSPPPRKVHRSDSPPTRKARRSASPVRKPQHSPSPLPRKVKRSPSPPRKAKRETPPLPQRKPKRELSPLPRPRESGHERGTPKASGSIKRKRVSTPTFTSDEDEDEDERPVRVGGNTSAREPASSVTSTSSSSQDRDPRPTPRPPRMPSTAPLPRDRAALEDRYSQAYDEYIQLFSVLSREKTKIRTQLRAGGGATGASEDEDAGFMSEGELRIAVKRFDAWSKELAIMREAAMKRADS